jgi:hypothetical protein
VLERNWAAQQERPQPRLLPGIGFPAGRTAAGEQHLQGRRLKALNVAQINRHACARIDGAEVRLRQFLRADNVRTTMKTISSSLMMWSFAPNRYLNTGMELRPGMPLQLS